MKSNYMFPAIVIFVSSLLLLISTPLAALESAAKSRASTAMAAPGSSSNEQPGILIHLAAGPFDPLSTLPSWPSALILSRYPDNGPGYYLIQFHGPITEADKQVLAELGAEIFDYIPDFTFIVKMDQVAQSIISIHPRVRWVGLYQPAYRVAPTLLQTYQNVAPETIELVVVVFKGEELASLTTSLARLGGTILETTQTSWKSKISLKIKSDQIPAVAHLAGVKWVERAPQWQLFNNEAATIMRVREVWDTHGLRGAGQTIAIADTGLDQGLTAPANLHDDFEDGGGNSRVVQIFDLVGDGSNDTNGHGTHVAGSAVGNGVLSGALPISHTYPVSAYTGIAPEAGLIFQSAANNTSGALQGIPLDLNTLFAQADAAGADLHTNSWGSPVELGSYSSLTQDVDEYIWSHPEFTVLFAAGNQAIDNNGDGVVDPDSITFPGTAKNAITVGATENNRLSGGYNPGGPCSTWGTCFAGKYPANPIRDDQLSNNPEGLAAFSGRGPTDDGRVKPDLVAPGTNIASTRSSQASSAGWGIIDTNYRYLGGTSMSTPLVAGAAALVREFYQTQQSFTPSAALVKATLINGATDIAPGQYGAGSTQEIPNPLRPNHVSGWGRVNLENSLFPAAPTVLAYDDERVGLNTSGLASYTYTVTAAGHPLAVTLAWSDYPGSPVANGGLVNDLDLSLVSPEGITLTLVSTSSDHLNNIEGFEVSSALTGVYTITVQGYNVPQGPQPYALVVRGAGVLGQSNLTSPITSNLYLPIITKPAPVATLPSLRNGDFEAGQDGSWTESSKKGYDLIVDSFAPNPLQPHSGEWAVWLGGAFDEVAELSQSVAIPAGTTSLRLTYWYAISSVDDCGFDHGWLEINGAPLKNYSLCADNNTGGWTKETVDMSGYAGQTVTIKFHLDTDGLKNSNLFLDDVAFEGPSLRPGSEPTPSLAPTFGGSANAQPRSQEMR